MSSYEIWSLVTASVMAVSTVLYVFFTLKMVRTSNQASLEVQHQNAIMSEQKQLLLEQKTDAFLMEIINGFNNYKKSEIFQLNISKFNTDILRISVLPGIVFENMDSERDYYYFAKELLSASRVLFNKYQPLRRFACFFWDMVLKIEESKVSYSENKMYFFTPYFFSRLSQEETNVLLLSEVIGIGIRNETAYLMNIPDIQSFANYLSESNKLLKGVDAGRALHTALKRVIEEEQNSLFS